MFIDGEDVEYDIAPKSDNGKISAINVTGPNGAPVIGVQSQNREDGEGSPRFNNRESPRRYDKSQGSKSYPRQPYGSEE